MQIIAAGNTEVPAYTVLVAKGYEVSYGGAHGDLWLARRDGDSFSAESPLMLLGLVTIAESRGSNWQATDAESHDFLETFPGAGQP
jgi:hypothetical protein